VIFGLDEHLFITGDPLDLGFDDPDKPVRASMMENLTVKDRDGSQYRKF